MKWQTKYMAILEESFFFFFFLKYSSEERGGAAPESNSRWQRNIYTLKQCHKIKVCCKNLPSAETVMKLSVFLPLDISFLGS